jgi:1,2-diacylglycerol 3-beta-glucosyltransferase
MTGRSERPSAAPWTLAVLAGVAAIGVGLLGVNRAAAVAVIALAVLFMVFLLRHLAFAASALSTARLDMHGRGSFDYGYRPPVTVMVPCRNEELVIEGMLTCLLALRSTLRSPTRSAK